VDQAKFKKLRDKWYAKLEKTGFKDIEDNKYDEPKLKVYDYLKFKAIPPDLHEARKKYYSNCRDVLNVHRFESVLHRKIWELHTDGMSLREIERAIKQEYKKDTINAIIRKISLESMPK
jgi:hypothetical protein